MVKYKLISPHEKVGTDGSFWSCLEKVKIHAKGFSYVYKKVDWYRKNPYVAADGYEVVRLHEYRKGGPKRLSRLILMAFVGPPPKGMIACHNNGNKLDNRLENLRWDTYKNNESDKKNHGTWDRRGVARKMDESMILQVHELKKQGKPYTEIEKIIGVLAGTISVNLRKYAKTHPDLDFSYINYRGKIKCHMSK